MPVVKRQIKVFFAYAQKDEELRDKLEKHLAILKYQKIIDAWSDKRIGIGDNTEGTIVQELEAADLILLLVSSDFLNSNFIWEVVMKRALERHEAQEATVLPIILRACMWDNAPFSHLDIVPKDRLPVARSGGLSEDEVLLDVAEHIKMQVQQIRGMGRPNGFPLGGGINTTLSDNTPKLGNKLHLFCNRFSQSVNFGEQLTQHLPQQGNKRPFAYILHGNRTEQHNSLVERFVEEYLKKLSPQHKEGIHEIVVPFTPNITDLKSAKASLKRNIAKRIHSPKTFHLTPQDIVQAKHHYKIVLMEHNIYSNDWNATTGALFKWYMNEFWNLSLAPHQPQFLIFVNIKYDTSLPTKKGFFSRLFGGGKSKNDQLKNDLQDLATNNSTFDVLDKLRSVEQQDIHQWFDDYAMDLEQEYNLERSMLIQQLFKNSEKQPMELVEKTLKKAVASAIRL
ncbi:MAG: TIR domain-containing protein [Chitinophagales bacterium]